MRDSWWYAARRPPSLGLLLPLAVAALMVGSVESDSSALELLQSRRPCPAHPPLELPPLEWTACPDRCICSSEDVQLSCHGPDLPDLPDAGAVDVRTMVVQGVGIHRLQAKHFRGLNSLQFLTLSNGRISEIAEDAFMDLQFLTYLDLSNNEIVKIPVDAFAHNKNLLSLNLGGNPLYVPSSGPLLLSASLQILILRGCSISSVNSQTFAGVPLLSEILMEDNPLTELPGEAISGLNRLCDIRVDELIKIDTIGTRDTSSEEDLPGIMVKYNKEILIFVSGTVLIAVVFIVVYISLRTCARPCRRNKREAVQERRPNSSEHRSSSRWTETTGPPYEEIDYRTIANGRGSGYHILSQRDMRPPANGYPGYVYNGVDFSRERYSYTENYGLYVPASNYRRPTDRLPPPPYENIGRDRLVSHNESVSTSTTDLRTSVNSDLNV